MGDMSEDIELRPVDYFPAHPPRDVVQRFGIAAVGCGEIARLAHQPAYRAFGYQVVAACDVVAERARRLAADFDIPSWTTRIEEVLERSDVHIVDLAVHPGDRMALVAKIAAAGKHILSQKPFALSLADARRMVALCNEAGITLMINQQARWAPAHRALRVLLDRGVLGRLYSVVYLNRNFQDIPGSGFVQLKHFNLADHGVHFIDLSRYLTGQHTARVTALTTMVADQVAVTPMIYSVLLDYGPQAGLMATLHFNNIVQTSHLHSHQWFLDGSEGSVLASHEEIVVSRKDAAAPITLRLEGNWPQMHLGQPWGRCFSPWLSSASQ